MDLSNYLSFLGAAILLTLMPGPDILFVLTESLTQGMRRGVYLAIGLCSGVFVHTLLAATGLTLLIQQSNTLFNLIKYLGAAYLMLMAYGASREQAVPSLEAAVSHHAGQVDLSGSVRKGFLMNVLNPKVGLFFLALLPQFLTAQGWKPAIQFALMGGTFAVQAFLIFSTIAYLAGKVHAWLLGNARIWFYAKWGKVLLFAGLGLALLFSTQ